MDLLMALGATLAAALLALAAIRAQKKNPSGSDARIMDSGQEHADAPHEEPAEKTDIRSLQRKKAEALERLLDRIKETEGLTQSSCADISALENGLDSIKSEIEGAKKAHEIREAGIRMDYAQSRTEWIIRSYPRLRNNREILSLRKEIQGINNRLKR